MKKIIVALLILTIFTFSVFCAPVSAVEASETKVTVEYLDNGCYIETIITQNTLTRGTISGTKTRNFNNSNGDVLWYVSVTGTFTYNGATSYCHSCSHNAKSNSSYWTIRSVTSDTYVNTATATAVARQSSGTASHDFTASVTLTCAKDGTLS
ncbi:MAG: hypothetical protein E7566_04000 [Ruminococcaceae bacterium]|nr:hypothetical protein [Oscillospiraceae bacterium]